LKYRGLITTWTAKEIGAGEEIIQQIDIHLNTSHIILLLISANFLASAYCYSREMMQAIQRHERGEASVIPVLLRPVVFTDMPFAKLHPLPANGKPVVNWRNRDSAFVDIAIGIERVVQKRFVMPPPLAFSQDPFPLVPSGQLHLYRAVLKSRSRKGPILVGLSLLLLGLLSTGILLLQHPNLIPLIGGTVGSLILLAGIVLAVRALVKRAQSRVAQRREQQRQEEQKQERRQYYEKYLREYEQKIHINAKPAYYKGKGDVLVKLERYEEAVVAYQQSLALDDSSAPTYSGMSRALSGLGRVQEAEQAKAQAQTKRQEQEKRIYYEKALTAYEQALHQNNADATAYRGKSNALVGLERYNEALTAFEQALQLAPLPVTHVSIGDVFTTLGRYHEAVAAYEQALSLDASYVSAYFGKSKALFQLGRTQEAEQAYQQAKELGGED
jgi:Flp pilus assembly protein TadD